MKGLKGLKSLMLRVQSCAIKGFNNLILELYRMKEEKSDLVYGTRNLGIVNALRALNIED